jgi:hypothetical protein
MDGEEIRVWVDASSPREAIEKALAETEDSGMPNRRAAIVWGDSEEGQYLVSIEEDNTVEEPSR